jgi:hypothetical protein
MKSSAGGKGAATDVWKPAMTWRGGLLLLAVGRLRSRCCPEGDRCDHPLLPARIAQEDEKPADTQRAFVKLCHLKNSGAGEGIRTLDPDLGKFRYLVAFR